jgi:hypothetical protein
MNSMELVSFTLPVGVNRFYVAELSNGKDVYQDTREKTAHAWRRLKQFLEANTDLKIVGMRLVEGNHSFDMPKNQKGYIYGMKEVRVFPFGGQGGAVCVGYFDGENSTMFWISNKGDKVAKETRSKEQTGFFLIENR